MYNTHTQIRKLILYRNPILNAGFTGFWYTNKNQTQILYLNSLTKVYMLSYHRCSITHFVFRIGVNGFENPLRDPKTEEFKKQIGSGCKLKMDDTGMNINIILLTWCDKLDKENIKIFIKKNYLEWKVHTKYILYNNNL